MHGRRAVDWILKGPGGTKTRSPDRIVRRQRLADAPKGLLKALIGCASGWGDRTVCHRTLCSSVGELAVEAPSCRQGVAVSTTSPRRVEGLARRRAVRLRRHGKNAKELRRLITCV